MADLTGQQLNNYRLVQHLGRGGFADVYLGEHLYLRSYAALKLMHIALEGEAARNFLFEAQTLVRLNHRHIVRVLDFRIDRGYPVLIMDYVAGGTLRQRHERGACLALDLVVHYVKQVAEALQFAHNQQVIHRDVKPENVLLDTEQHLYLSDFGLALFAPSPGDLDTQKLVGTLPYTAPEQWQGHATFASDQYSLAIMAYEWLCGKRPFEGNHIALFSQHSYEAPAPLRDLCPELPEGVEQVILRALAKDPDERFVSVRAFALALERASLEEITETGRGRVAPADSLASPSRLEAPVQRKLFIAAASADRAFTERVCGDLRQRDIHLAYDVRTPLKQEGELREAVRASYLVMVVASPQMRTSRTVREQLRIALLYRRRLVFVWARGENIAAALLDLAGRTAPIDVIDARDGRYEIALDEIIDCLQEDTNLTPVVVTPLASLNDEPRNPYKGLRAFTKEDASDFFGRDALVQRILGILENMLDPRKPLKANQRLLTVVGPSGSGKSSAVMAGVLPKLQRGALEGSEKWCYVETMVPGQHPCEALLATLARQFPPQSGGEVRKVLAAEHGYGLYQIAGMLSKPTNRRVVLCVDQFEEIFAIGVPEAERQHFLKVLLAAVSEPQSSLVVLLTLRADFYDRPMHYRELATLIVANQVSILPMDNQELRTAIEQPAAQADVQLFFEGDLVGDLLFELQGQGGALPLLEFTLEQLFRQRQGHWLTQEAYRAIGGLRGALARHAEDVYSGLPSDEHRKLARTLFLRLIDPGKSEQDTTRRRAALSELLFVDEKETRLMSEVMHSFISARLLTTTMIANVTSLEVSHEALIREWPRLAGWLQGAREDIVLQHAITADAAIWQKLGQAADRLYRGVELAEAVRWLGRNRGNADEVAFVRAGEAEERRREMEEEERLRRELRLKKQTVQRLQAFLVAVSIFLIASIAFAGVISGLNSQLRMTNVTLKYTAAKELLDLHTSQALNLSASVNANATKGNIDTALLLANAAVQRQPDNIKMSNTLLETLGLNPQLIRMYASTPTVKRMIVLNTRYHVVIYSEGISVHIEDSLTGKAVKAFSPGKQMLVGALALSPDENTLAIASNEDIWLWNMRTDQITTLHAGVLNTALLKTGTHAALSFSADGKTLVSARCFQYDKLGSTDARCLQITTASWNVQSQKLIGTMQTIQGSFDTNTFIVNGDTNYLVTSNASTIELWNAATGQTVFTPIVSNANVNQLALNANGSMIAIATDNDIIQLWNTATGQTIGSTLISHTRPITALLFSADSKTLVSSSFDETVRVWDTQTRQLQMTLNADNQPKYGLALSGDGQTVCSTSEDGTLLLWDLNAYTASSHTLPSEVLMRSPLFSADGKWIYIGREDGKIEVRSLEAGTKKSLLLDTAKAYPAASTQGYPLSEHSLALSKDGSILVGGRRDGDITVWNMHAQPPVIISHLLYAHNPLDNVQVSEDGHILVASDTGTGTVIVWDISKPNHPIEIMPPARNRLPMNVQAQAALSPNGKDLALWSCSNQSCKQDQIKIWNIDNRSFTARSSAPQVSDGSGYLIFSPDNHTIASIVAGNRIQLWDSEQPEKVLRSVVIPLIDPTEVFIILHFSLDGKRIVSYSQNPSPTVIQPFSFVVWDMRGDTLTPLSETIQIPDSSTGDMSFSPDGQQLISAQLFPVDPGYKGLLLVWNANIASWQEKTCSIAQHDLSSDTWKQYGDGEAYAPVCPQFSKS